MLRALRRYVERFPPAAALYRAVRDELATSGLRAFATPFGFQLAGRSDMADGSFEPEETRYLVEHLPQFDVFVDVGANIGFYSCLARRLGREVVAIEPMVHNLRLLYQNLHANGWSDTEVFPVGLGARPGLRDIYGGGTGASLVKGWADSTAAYRVTIPVSTLDIVLGGRFREKRLFVKIDVEGAEYDVLSGAAATLAQVPAPTLLVEVSLSEMHPGAMHPRFREVFELLWNAGYEAATVAENRRVRPEDVERWTRTRRQDFGSHNFIFCSPRR